MEYDILFHRVKVGGEISGRLLIFIIDDQQKVWGVVYVVTSVGIFERKALSVEYRGHSDSPAFNEGVRFVRRQGHVFWYSGNYQNTRIGHSVAAIGARRARVETPEFVTP